VLLAERQSFRDLNTGVALVRRRRIMKTIFATVCLFAVALASPVQAKGCIKGAIVGGVAGHMAGRVLHGNPGKPGLRYHFGDILLGARRQRRCIEALELSTRDVFAYAAQGLAVRRTRDEELIFEITGIGPIGIDYLNPEDDPRK
jgi:hypothetical protein